MLNSIRRRAIGLKKVYWAKNIKDVLNEIWCSNDYNPVTSLFEMVGDKVSRDEVRKKKKK